MDRPPFNGDNYVKMLNKITRHNKIEKEWLILIGISHYFRFIPNIYTCQVKQNRSNIGTIYDWEPQGLVPDAY